MQFGLLIPENASSTRRFALTSTSRLLLMSSSLRDRERPLRKAALTPRIHRELFTKFGGAGKIDDASIERYLVVDRALAHEAAFSASSARNLIREYRATMKEAALSEIEPQQVPAHVFQSDKPPSFFDFALSGNTRSTRSVASPPTVERGQADEVPKSEASHRSELAKSATNPDVAQAASSKTGEESYRLWDQGPLSPTAGYQLFLLGEVGEKEIEVLIRRLEISKQSLARNDKE